MGDKMNTNDILKKYCHFAVIGVTQNKEKYGYRIYQKLLQNNKNTYPISSIYTDIDGSVVYQNLTDVPHPIDVVVFVIRKDYAYPYIQQMVQLGIKYAWMQPGTYDDELLEYMRYMGISPIQACILKELQG